MGSGMVTGLTGSEGEESSCSRMEAGVENRWSKIREFCFKDLPPSVYSETFLPSGIPVILLITPKEVYASCDNFCPINLGLHNKCPKNWTHHVRY